MNAERSLADIFARYDGFVFDLDGTIYLGDAPISGAPDVVDTLRKHGKRVVFLSNKPLSRREAYAAKLTRLGIPASADDVVNSSSVLAHYLSKTAPGAVVYVVGEPPLIEELREAGLHVVVDPSGRYQEVDVVVAAFDRTFDYEKLNHAYQAIAHGGARFVATNPDRTCPIEGGEIPDCAAMIGAIEGCTGKQVEIVVGKPNPLMLEAAADRLGVPLDRCLMTGDRLETDILMGVKAGMATAAVLSGVATLEDVRAFRERHGNAAPTHVLRSVSDMLSA